VKLNYKENPKKAVQFAGDVFLPALALMDSNN